MYVYTYIYIYIHTYISVCVCMCVCVYVCMYIYMCVYAYVYIHVNTYTCNFIYTHIHIYLHLLIHHCSDANMERLLHQTLFVHITNAKKSYIEPLLGAYYMCICFCHTHLNASSPASIDSPSLWCEYRTSPASDLVPAYHKRKKIMHGTTPWCIFTCASVSVTHIWMPPHLHLLIHHHSDANMERLLHQTWFLHITNAKNHTWNHSLVHVNMCICFCHTFMLRKIIFWWCFMAFVAADCLFSVGI